MEMKVPEKIIDLLRDSRIIEGDFVGIVKLNVNGRFGTKCKTFRSPRKIRKRLKVSKATQNTGR